MSKPHKCPVCEASGKYAGKTCHGCDGKGLVWEPAGQGVQPFPWVPMPIPIPATPAEPWTTGEPWCLPHGPKITWYIDMPTRFSDHVTEHFWDLLAEGGQ